jgi:hypothetical protein
MNEEQAKELKAKHKRFVKITLDGKVLAFKPLDKAKAQQFHKEMKKAPELGVDLCVNTCKFLCVFGAEHFDDLARDYPLAFAGGGEDSPGVIDALLKLAHGGVSIEEC